MTPSASSSAALRTGRGHNHPAAAAAMTRCRNGVSLQSHDIAHSAVRRAAGCSRDIAIGRDRPDDRGTTARHALEIAPLLIVDCRWQTPVSKGRLHVQLRLALRNLVKTPFVTWLPSSVAVGIGANSRYFRYQRDAAAAACATRRDRQSCVTGLKARYVVRQAGGCDGSSVSHVCGSRARTEGLPYAAHNSFGGACRARAKRRRRRRNARVGSYFRYSGAAGAADCKPGDTARSQADMWMCSSRLLGARLGGRPTPQQALPITAPCDLGLRLRDPLNAWQCRPLVYSHFHARVMVPGGKGSTIVAATGVSVRAT